MFLGDVTKSHVASFSKLNLTGKLNCRRRGEEKMEDEEEGVRRRRRTGIPSPPYPSLLFLKSCALISD
ncbi:MAG: hypothetical protein O7D30_09745 [Rickettsia endosymbiont of Ixodes persulcatus]|nr:hypothetical protein [Rickettsia endosymbiont of Ixodes persulcatus]